MIKNKIDNFLENEVKDTRSKFEQLFAHEDKYLIETKIIEKKKFAQEILPDQMVFRRNRVNLILITIFGAGGFCSMGVALFLNEKGMIPPLILICLGIWLGIHIWFVKPNHKLTLSKSGIQFNSVLYEWCDIVSTHMVYIAKSNDDKSYLILELRNQRIEKLEISEINFSNFFKDDGPGDESVFGHYIEKYKLEYNKACNS